MVQATLLAKSGQSYSLTAWLRKRCVNWKLSFCILILILVMFAFQFHATYFYNDNWRTGTEKLVSVGKDCSNLPPIRTLQDLPNLSNSVERRRLNAADANGKRLEQDDPMILTYIHNNCDVLLRPPDGKATTYMGKSRSMGQDEVVRKLLNNTIGGFFIECGGMDGISSSNTLMFERDSGWQGLLIEASAPELVKLHKLHRNAWISHACLSILDYPIEVMFHQNHGRGKISNVINVTGPVEKTGPTLRDVRVQCFPLYSFIAALNVSVVDYLSLDVEGHELQILKTLPFHKVVFKVITVEFVTSPKGPGPLREFMESKGFQTVGTFYHGKTPFDFIFAHNSVFVNLSVRDLLKPIYNSLRKNVASIANSVLKAQGNI